MTPARLSRVITGKQLLRGNDMKSCRNCAHSRHDGSFRVDLVCPVIGEQVAPLTKCTEENHKADQHCRNLAAGCPAYTPEGESK